MASNDRTRPGVLFDVDGTLVDANYLHVAAWWEAFRECGYEVRTADIHAAIGKGSDQLVEALVGRPDSSISAAHSRHYAPYLGLVRPFRGAAALLRATADMGLAVVVASSVKSDEIDLLLDTVGGREAIATVASSGDVERTKPEPDPLQEAMEEAGLDPSACVMVGDTVWDVEASRRAGVPCVAVRTGGWTGQQLRAAGAVEVYDDVAALLENLDNSSLGQLARGGIRRP